MKLGVDLSIVDELERKNPVFFVNGKEIEPFSYFGKVNGISLCRLRLWVDPYDEKGNPYGGGTNDLPAFLRLAKRAKEAGMAILLDIHYSDFWVDPSRQILPKAWRGKSYGEVVEAMHDYTLETLKTIREEGIDLYAIQVGNEITNGMVFPFGQSWIPYEEGKGGGYEGLATLLKAGLSACKEVYPNAKRVLHLEHPASFDIQDKWLSEVTSRGVEFEVLGESYYPYWHGALPKLKQSLSALMDKYHKPVWIVEAGYEFSPEPGRESHEGIDYFKEEEFVVGDLNGRVPFPPTKQGQAAYLRYLIRLCMDMGVEALFYWEPTWAEKEDAGWAKAAGQRYCGLEPGPNGNPWSREILFDERGNANPALEVFSEAYLKSLE